MRGFSSLFCDNGPEKPCNMISYWARYACQLYISINMISYWARYARQLYVLAMCICLISSFLKMKVHVVAAVVINRSRENADISNAVALANCYNVSKSSSLHA